ncbi:MAG TPA: DUF72 domain-containing protein [Armatimonadetes bacterium]|nr:DUF72 domain-containing protein [Armatimonadota bacterium]
MIFIGTSGFSYDDWRGHFYPQTLDKRDMLTFYAQHFPAVEVNSTYYRLPSPYMLSQLAAKTPPKFRFVVKAYKGLTHEREKAQPKVFAEFRRALEPLRQMGKFGCILVQFPYSFKPAPESFRYLGFLAEQFADWPTVVEFRHAAWVTEETFAWLREHSLGYCCVDEPRLKGLLPPVVQATSSLGYVRFHGRNAEKWWRHEEPWQRYDYLYRPEELASWVPRIQALAEQTEATYVFFNNHYRAKAALNARQLAQQLGLPLLSEGS